MLMPRTCSLSIGTAQDSSVPRSCRFGFVPGSRMLGMIKAFGTMHFAGRTHQSKDDPAICMRRIGRRPDIHPLAEFRGLARHLKALALRVVEPAMIAAADAPLLDLPPFQ